MSLGTPFPAHRALVLCALALLLSPACKKKEPDAAAPADPDAGEVVAITLPEGGAAGDGGAAAAPTIYALGLVTPVMSAPEWAPHDASKTTEERKGVVRLGYLRKGDRVKVKPQLVKKSSCLEGWYELAPPSYGFVCGKYATLDPNDKELANAPHAPNMSGPLPYEYGLNLVNGAPLYRRPPLRRERAEYERGLAVGRAFRKKPGEEGESAPPVPKASKDDGSGESPWYLAHTDKSQISMDELKGETSLIEKRMVRGFYLALDTNVHAFAGSFWRTTRGMFTPKDHVLVHDPKVEFEGVWLDKPGPGPDDKPKHLPLAWITNPHQWKYVIEEGGQKVHRNEHVDRFTVVQLTGKKQVIDNKRYWETEEGWWMREMDGTMTDPAPPPFGIKPGERWIDVNLGKQTLVAFEGDKPVFATIVSTGRHSDDPAKDHRTHAGDFRIREKHVSATMDNDTATDGPYSIEDVPWIMYFDGSTALHGAFWHSRFGHERSHGCVNMTPHDAHEMFGWVGPTLPEGWHGVHATEANPGTRVVVHDDGKTAEESKKSRKEKDEAAKADKADSKDDPQATN